MQRQEYRQAVPQWEYKEILQRLDGGLWTVEAYDTLSQLGREGWELIIVYPVETMARDIGLTEHRTLERAERWILKRATPL